MSENTTEFQARVDRLDPRPRKPRRLQALRDALSPRSRARRRRSEGVVGPRRGDSPNDPGQVPS